MYASGPWAQGRHEELRDRLLMVSDNSWHYAALPTASPRNCARRDWRVSSTSSRCTISRGPPGHRRGAAAPGGIFGALQWGGGRPRAAPLEPSPACAAASLRVAHGALSAPELAVTRPAQVRRLVLVSVPLLTDAERESLRRTPPPTPPALDGSQLPSEWQRTVQAYGQGAPVEIVARAFAEKLCNGTHAAWTTSAAAQYPLRERLGLITQQVLVLR